MSTIQQLLTEHIDIWTAAETEKKSGRGRASGNAGSVYGIKKLRELILELAVRGKLVSQDDNDEPASELLKRIQAEKAKLIAEGKIKKDKPLAAITEVEQLFELPQGWEWVRLGFLGEIKGGKRLPAGSTFSIAETPYIYIQVTNMKDGAIIEESLKYIDQHTHNLIKQYTISSSDLYITIAGTIGDVGSVPDRFNGMNLTENAAKIVFLVISKDWLKCSLRSSFSRSQFSDKTIQMAQPKLALHRIADSVIALPPLAEQHRIVAKVDELMALCDQLENQHSNAAEAHEKLVSHLLGTLTQSQNGEDFTANWQRIAAYFDTLFATDSSIDALKQTLLQLAVMGKLVPQDANDEPASELLKRIQTEKAKLIAEGKIKKDKPLPPITEDEKPFDLPKGWELIRLAAIINMSSGEGLTSENMDKTGAIPVFGGNGITGYHTQFNTEEQTLVIGRVGFYCGSIHLTPVHAWITDNALRVKFSKENIAINFLYWLLTATNLKENESATAQPLVTGRKIYPIVIGMPPLAEQHRIVAKVDELMALCDQLKTRIMDASRLQQKLADVLVEQAVA